MHERPKGLGLPRIHMPQIDSLTKFYRFLEVEGIEIRQMMLFVDDLFPTQMEFNEEKIDVLAELTVQQLTEHRFPVSLDRYILDGHHHWAALFKKQSENPAIIRVKVDRIQLSIDDLLKKAREYPGTTYKSINEKVNYHE